MFAKNTTIQLNDGSIIFVEDLRAGDIVKGGYRVKTVVVHEHGPFDIALVSPGLRISMWHPMKAPGTQFWVFPIHNAHSYQLDVNEPMYDLVLDSGHMVVADGITCCTLGHGIKDHVAGHEYFGTERVLGDIGPEPVVYVKNLRVLRNSQGIVYKWLVI